MCLPLTNRGFILIPAAVVPAEISMVIYLGLLRKHEILHDCSQGTVDNLIVLEFGYTDMEDLVSHHSSLPNLPVAIYIRTDALIL